jgi:hypothetical protein
MGLPELDVNERLTCPHFIMIGREVVLDFKQGKAIGTQAESGMGLEAGASRAIGGGRRF